MFMFMFMFVCLFVCVDMFVCVCTFVTHAASKISDVLQDSFACARVFSVQQKERG